MGRPETDSCLRLAMNQLGNGLDQAGNDEDALPVREAELSMLRRVGAPEKSVLVAQSNLAGTCSKLGRVEDASRIQRDVYSGTLNLLGAEHLNSLAGAKRQNRTFAAPSRASASSCVRSPSCQTMTSASPTYFMCVRSDAIDALRVFA